MSLSHGPFHPDELGGPDAGVPTSEQADATAAARELEAALSTEGIHPSREFVSRVMQSLESEPAPRAGGFLAGLLAHPNLGAFRGSLRGAWAVASGGAGRTMAARGVAMAYVLAVVLIGASLTGAAAIATAGALGLLDNDASPAIIEPSPSPSPSPTLAPTPSTPDPSTSPEPSERTEPSGSGEPEPSNDSSPSPAATAPSARPTASPAGPSPSPSHDDSSSPDPSDTPRPADSPKPSESPH